MIDLYQRAAEDLAATRAAAALTGAGISVESGIPPFRGPGGLWEKLDPMEFAHIDSFVRNPERVWRMMISTLKDTLDSAQPGQGHRGLASLERRGILQTVITQNVDGLHQAAGSRDVIEFHGSFARQRCMACERRLSTADVDTSVLPPRCDCGGVYRPDCVFFGEAIDSRHLYRSQQICARCEVMLVVGTSAEVQPAALMPVIAKRAGATVIEINPEPTALTGTVSDYLIPGPAGEVFGTILEELDRRG